MVFLKKHNKKRTVFEVFLKQSKKDYIKTCTFVFDK